MKNLKQYAVEVIEHYSHGKYGKAFYFGLYVCGFNKKDAEQIALEMVSEMTFEEINERCVKDNMKPWQIWYEPQHGSDKPIGIELADMFFKCNAYTER